MKFIEILFALAATTAQAITFDCGNLPETDTAILLATGGNVEFDGKKYDAMKITLRTKEGFAPKSDWYYAQDTNPDVNPLGVRECARLDRSSG